MHRLAEHCILSGLKKGGLVQGNTDAAVQDRIGALFMPHGVPHILTIDVCHTITPVDSCACSPP